ncbi:astacin-like metalloprotease toxin 1 [Caerostris darwini]|uniref:Metalloendopeptidase n=1 Tax=Caerostris darwini TaxID=1538125 RepID=A0AAV4PB30_9ARAC|nr:hypothetical protein CDAR_57681 [Caerostris darwini]GIX93104.1 astacin-like metalloprotease toxin 1 [Caerostris darwini]
MWWQFLLALATFFNPLRGPTDNAFDISVDPDEYVPTAWGPRNWSDADAAMQAIHGEGDDMRFVDDDHRNAAIKDERYRWPKYRGKAIVYYKIDKSLSDQRALIKEAMEQYHKHTCIRFVEGSGRGDYILIKRDEGCYSYVGKIGGEQIVSLGYGCDFVGTIVHELGHALCLFHTHQRSDRDEYIRVYIQNVVDGQQHNFLKTNPQKEIMLDKHNYNWNSIMHYGEYAFSKQPGLLKTMESKNPRHHLREPYDKPGLHAEDIKLINYVYKC